MTKSSGSSCDRAQSKRTTTTTSTEPVASSSSSFWSRSVSSLGADSGRTTVAGWRSKVTTVAAAPTASASRRSSPSTARCPRWTPS